MLARCHPFGIPASMSAQAIPGFNDLLDRRTRWMQVLGRLNRGMTLEKAQAGLQPWFKAMLQEDTHLASFPATPPERRQAFLSSSLVLAAAPQGHAPLRRQLLQPLWMLFGGNSGSTGLACLNVSGLFLARGSARDREIATRLALGASPWRIGRQFLADSLLIALEDYGTAAAPIVVRTLVAFVPRASAPTALYAGIDLRLLGFAFVVSVAAGLLRDLLQRGRRDGARLHNHSASEAARRSVGSDCERSS